MLDQYENSIARQVMAQFDAPAFVRRACRVEEAWQSILARCRRQRDEWLKLPRMRLATLRALAGDWTAVAEALAVPSQVHELEALFTRWRPQLRVWIAPAGSRRRIDAALRDLIASFERFNVRWSRFVAAVDLTGVNELRLGYNRFYVLEKECAVRSAAIARQGFRPLAPATTDDLLAIFPPLPVQRIAAVA
jgi:hypothetical protein